jgi:FixJ family two-component response regulator
MKAERLEAIKMTASAISSGTVKVHRKNIYAKLGIMSQSELFSIFLNALSKREGPAAVAL